MSTHSPTLRQQLIGMAFASPYLLGVALFLVLPLGLTLYYSFCDYNMLQPPMWIGWDNYRHILADEKFYTVLKNTLLFAAMSLPFSLTLSVLLALLLNRPNRTPGLWRTCIFLPSLVPAVASAMLWLWLLNSKQGLINQLLKPPLHALGMALGWAAGLVGASRETVAMLSQLAPPPWLQSESWAMPALVFIGAWGVGNTVVIFLAGLQDIPLELYESAEIDSANAWQRLRHITLPMLSPVIFFNLVMGIIGSWQVFTGPYILTGGGPNFATYFYSMYVFDVAFPQLRTGYAAALSMIQFLIILMLTGLVFWSSRKWVHYR